KAQEQEESDNGDFWVDEKNHNVILSEAGHVRVEQILVELGLIQEGDSLYNVNNISLMHHLLSALKAHYVYFKDQHYVIQDGEVVIVDEFTGRLMSGRRWSDGLHQAVEAKEGVEIQRENQTLASITFQNYFRMYKKLSGMTGTADTEAYEFQQIYALETVVIPTNKPTVRKDYNDKIYLNIEDKFAAIVADLKECSSRGQPALVGTTSVESSEQLSRLLSTAGLKHSVLNAKQHAREADIIVQAGYPGNITVATNMAGRGTDIILGGNPKPSILAIENNNSLTPEQKQQEIAQLMQDWHQRNELVLAAGGLYIIGTERHESRRIDNQLRGRSGRQGDPGASRFYLSLDDSLLRIFGGEKMRGMMQRLGMVAGEAIEHRFLSRSIESAQRKVEGHNFDIRKQLLDYDDVANAQRKVIYAQRNEVLTSDDLSPMTYNMLKTVIGDLFDSYIPAKSLVEMWDIHGLEKILRDEYLIDFPIQARIDLDPNIDEQLLRSELLDLALTNYQTKITNFMARIANEINQYAQTMLPENSANWDLNSLNTMIMQNGINEAVDFATMFANETNRDVVLATFNDYAKQITVAQVTRFERSILLQHLDLYWREHLTQLEHLRQGIGLRGYAQKDPKQEYKREAFDLFSNMLDGIKQDAVKVLLTVRLQSLEDVPNDNFAEEPDELKLQHSSIETNSTDPVSSTISRNSPCPCGSGKKYKHCHGSLT
ncbi:MAG: hypothetical protein RLZZ293_134, partial [Pseudomonadota bacterium]